MNKILHTSIAINLDALQNTTYINLWYFMRLSYMQWLNTWSSMVICVLIAFVISVILLNHYLIVILHIIVLLVDILPSLKSLFRQSLHRWNSRKSYICNLTYVSITLLKKEAPVRKASSYNVGCYKIQLLLVRYLLRPVDAYMRH